MDKDRVKELLARVPGLPEMYWRLVDHGGPTIHYAGRNTLDRLAAHLPDWGAAAQAARETHPEGRSIHIFASFRYWIEHACLLGFALSGLGHRVRLSYLPYYKYRVSNNTFDLRRQNAYIRSVLKGAAPLLAITPLMDVQPDEAALPAALDRSVEEISFRDGQYATREEAVRTGSGILALREARNRFAAERTLALLRRTRPELVIVPNGSVLEFAVVYQTARYLELPALTYEFDEPRERIRLALNDEVMREDTTDFWRAYGREPLSPEEEDRLEGLVAARQGGEAWGDFRVRFQDRGRQGGEQLRASLGLDSRPVVLLAPNVFGDSATLGRQVFSNGLSDWVERSVEYFLERPQFQLVIRIHPSEAKFTYGTSISDVIRDRFPELPPHIKPVEAKDPVNTYDLIEVADLGLVYTTTVGLEMALSGLPVVVAGQTHYRGKGFTIDPATWQEYFQSIDRVLGAPQNYRLSRGGLETARRYAYRFFFDFTRPFPWHLLHFWEDVETWPLGRVLSEEGMDRFGETFNALAGEEVGWRDRELSADAR
jgi:hypothetical protein